MFDSPEGPIRCELKAFLRATVPPYQALSYMWGQPSPTFKIFINGRTFTVRKNLYDFLLAARRNSWISTWIWIDQLCINQENLSERASQVQDMGTTYEDAEEVLIWLGHHGWIGDVAIEKMRNEIFSTHEWNEVDPDGDVHHAIMSNPYWTRMWIAQEIHLARRICILC
ncbi:HET-domain-containing protein, partial [Lentithecium fluviatile CBS 122367]